MVQEVYGYWVSKRQRFKKPLLRKFWPVTSINDTNPHLVFRPREKERYDYTHPHTEGIHRADPSVKTWIA
jgi:hypothetical protein